MLVVGVVLVGDFQMLAQIVVLLIGGVDKMCYCDSSFCVSFWIGWVLGFDCFGFYVGFV